MLQTQKSERNYQLQRMKEAEVKEKELNEQKRKPYNILKSKEKARKKQLREVIDKVKTEILTNGKFNIGSIRSLNQLDRILKTIRGTNRFKDIIPKKVHKNKAEAEFSNTSGRWVIIVEVHYEYGDKENRV